MPISLTTIGVCHAVDLEQCLSLPAGQQHITLPLAGAPAFRCPHPCGGVCRFASVRPALPAHPLPAKLVLDLRLATTLAGLVAAAVAVTEPLGTANDATGPASSGCQRLYQN